MENNEREREAVCVLCYVLYYVGVCVFYFFFFPPKLRRGGRGLRGKTGENREK